MGYFSMHFRREDEENKICMTQLKKYWCLGSQKHWKNYDSWLLYEHCVSFIICFCSYLCRYYIFFFLPLGVPLNPFFLGQPLSGVSLLLALIIFSHNFLLSQCLYFLSYFAALYSSLKQLVQPRGIKVRFQ